MAISVVSPAFIAPLAPPLNTARPQLEPVGFNQRNEFLGPINGLSENVQTAPTYLRTFTDRVNGLNTPDESPMADLFPSFSDRLQGLGQLDLFGDTSRLDANGSARQPGLSAFSPGFSAFSEGLQAYASMQNGTRPPLGGSLSLSV